MAMTKDEFVNAAKGLHNQCDMLIKLLMEHLPPLEKAVQVSDPNTIRNEVDALRAGYESIVAANNWISG